MRALLVRDWRVTGAILKIARRIVLWEVGVAGWPVTGRRRGGGVFSERSLYAIARPSVCRLSVCLSVCNVRMRPTQAVQIFGNISTALGTLATH